MRRACLLSFLFIVVTLSCTVKETEEPIFLKIKENILLGDNITVSYSARMAANTSALNHLSEIKNSSSKRKFIEQISNTSCNMNDWRNLYNGANLLEKLSEEAHDTLYYAKSQLLIGKFHLYNSNNNLAHFYFSRAYQFFTYSRNTAGMAEVHVNFAELYSYTSDFLRCERSALLAYRFSREAQNNYLMFNAIAWLAIASNDLGNYKSAEKLNCTALEILNKRKYRDAANIAHCIANMGHSNIKLRNFVKARRQLNKALKVLKYESNYPVLYCIILDKLAQIYILEGGDSHALDLLKRSEYLRKKFNVRQGENYNYIFQSQVYFDKDINKSKSLAEKALLSSREFKSPTDITASLSQLIEVDPHNASIYTEEYIYLSDSIQLQERNIKNKFASIEYETEELTIAKEAAVNLSWWIMGGSSSLLCVGSLFLLVIVQRNKKNEFKSKKQQQKLEEELFQTLLDQQIAYEQERQAAMNKVAMDLHDSVMNKLTSTRLNLFPLNRSAGPEALQKCIMFIKSLSNIEADIYQVAAQLDTEIESPEDFISSVEKIVGDFKNISTANVSLDIYQVNWETLQQTATSHLLNIIRETLYNTHKYANASELYISAMRLDKEIIFTIKDNGCGFTTDAQTFSGIGISNMRSRMELAGGSYEILSSHGKGTTTILRLPAR
ncbi:MAG TPA: ATP-binding protein [Flavobacterium sp.]|jgi:signal transduction histidine kinase